MIGLLFDLKHTDHVGNVTPFIDRAVFVYLSRKGKCHRGRWPFSDCDLFQLDRRDLRILLDVLSEKQCAHVHDCTNRRAWYHKIMVVKDAALITNIISPVIFVTLAASCSRLL